jgi:hypothetical protein
MWEHLQLQLRVFEMLKFRSWKAVFILSFIVPVSLLVTFRLTGVLHGPVAIAESTVLDVIMWEAERPDTPSNPLNIMDGVYINSLYENEIKLAQWILVADYDPSSEEYSGLPEVTLNFNLTASTPKGYIHSINLTAEEKNYAYAWVDCHQELLLCEEYKPCNLTVNDFQDCHTGLNQTAFIHLAGVNYPSKVSFWVPFRWLFYGPYNQTHVLNVTSELIYYNGTVFKKVVQPFQLKFGPDDNNTPETAMKIHEGNYSGLYLGSYIDTVDYYKIYTEQGQRIELHIYGYFPPPFFNVSVYNPEKRLFTTITEPRDNATIDFISNSAGYWTIEIQITRFGYGYYYVEVNR